MVRPIQSLNEKAVSENVFESSFVTDMYNRNTGLFHYDLHAVVNQNLVLITPYVFSLTARLDWMSEDDKESSPKHDRVVDLYFQTLHIENISHAPSFPEWKYIPFAPKGGNIQSRTSKFRFPYRCQSVLALSPNINPILCPPIISSLQDNFFLPSYPEI